jgi:hypothetical protein
VLRNTLKAERTASRPRHRPRHFFAAVHYEVNIGRKKGAPEVSGNDSRDAGNRFSNREKCLYPAKLPPFCAIWTSKFRRAMGLSRRRRRFDQ